MTMQLSRHLIGVSLGLALCVGTGGALPVPLDAVGRMRLLAIADISQGRLGRKTVFDEVFVTVQPTAELVSIDFETEKPLQLGRTGQSSAYGHVDSLGKIFELPVVGEFADGISRPLSSPGSGTVYTCGNHQILKVLPEGLLQIVGIGKTSLTVTNRGKQATLDVRVEVNPEPNEPPIAHAGTDKTVKAGTKVRLSGLPESSSRGPTGAPPAAWPSAPEPRPSARRPSAIPLRSTPCLAQGAT